VEQIIAVALAAEPHLAAVVRGVCAQLN